MSSSAADGDDENLGELVFSGSVSWSMVGRTSTTSAWDGVPKENQLNSFHRLAPFVDQKVQIKNIICGPHANHTVALVPPLGSAVKSHGPRPLKPNYKVKSSPIRPIDHV